MSFAIFFTSYVLNMFQTLIYPSPGACDYSVELPYWLYCSWFNVCWRIRLGWVKPATRIPLHQNTHRTKNNMTNVVIQQNSRKLLMLDILMSETCWAHKNWKKLQVTSSWSFILQLCTNIFEEPAITLFTPLRLKTAGLAIRMVLIYQIAHSHPARLWCWFQPQRSLRSQVLTMTFCFG